MIKRLIILLLIVISVLPGIAQEVLPDKFLGSQLFFAEANPESIAGIFSLDLPFYFMDKNGGEDQFSFGYSMGNIWSPQATLLYPQNLNSTQKEQIADVSVFDRPQYFEDEGIETENKTFYADGVLQHFKFTYLKKLTGKQSLIANMNLHMLNGGSSPVNYLVSDQLIEQFHTHYGKDDNFGRKLYPYNKASIYYLDEDGNSFKKDKGDVFVGVMDFHYYNGVFDIEKENWRFSTQLAAHLSVPLNSFHPYIIPGLSLGINSERHLGAKSSFSFALDVGITDQTFLKVGKGVHFLDWKYRAHAKAYVGFNWVSKKNNVTTVGILTNYQDPLMKGYYYDPEQLGYHEIGVQYLEEGDVWEGETISQEFPLAKLTPASLYFFSIKSYLILGFHKNNRTFNVFIGEDLISVNNAPDIQLGFQYNLALSFFTKE